MLPFNLLNQQPTQSLDPKPTCLSLSLSRIDVGFRRSEGERMEGYEGGRSERAEGVPWGDEGGEDCLRAGEERGTERGGEQERGGKGETRWVEDEPIVTAVTT